MLEVIKKRRAVRAKRKSTKGRKIVMCLGSIPKEGVPEMKVRYNKSYKRFLGKVTSSKDTADFIRKLYKRGSLELQEQFIVLYLNTRNEIIGYYKHTDGGIDRAIVDVRIILGTALKSLATAIIVAHNHPSGNTQPSQADKELTKVIKDSATVMQIRFLDHLIITKKEYSSFADEGLI